MTTPIFAAKTAAYSTPKFPSNGRFATVLVSGTWNGALVTIEASPDDGATWIATSAQLTANGVLNFIAGNGVNYRASLSSPGGSTNLNAWLAFEQ